MSNNPATTSTTNTMGVWVPIDQADFPISQFNQFLGEVIWPRTPAEGTATIATFVYSPGNILRAGAVDESNSASAIQVTLNQAQISNGAPAFVPQGSFTVDAALTVNAPFSIYGSGYYSVLKLPSGGSTLLPLLLQSPSTGIKGARIRDIRIDGNAGGQLSAGLIQSNNTVGFVYDGLWIENGSRTDGASNGVNGIAFSNAGGSANPAGVILNSTLQANSKAAINISTGSDGVTSAFNRTLSNTGNGTTPGIQMQDSFRSKILGNTTNANQGRGIYTGLVSSGVGDSYHLIALNHSYGNGTGVTEGDGIVVINQQATILHSRSTVADNIVASNGVNVTGSGIYLVNVKSVDTKDNYVHNNKAHGIRVQANSGIDGGHIRVIDNTIDANNTAAISNGAGVFVDGTFDHLEISRNKISNSDGFSGHRFGVCFQNGCVINDLVMKDNFITQMVTSEYFFGTITVTKFYIDIEGYIQTTDATPTTVFVFPIPDNTAAYVEFELVGVKSDGTDRAAYKLGACIFRNGGGATIQGGAATTFFTQESNAAWAPTLDVAANSIRARATGVAATIINWRWRIKAYSR